MSRLLWPFAVVLALVIGWAGSGTGGKTPAAREVERLTQQVTTLQAKLRVAEERAAAAPRGQRGDRRTIFEPQLRARPGALAGSVRSGGSAGAREPRPCGHRRASASRPVPG